MSLICLLALFFLISFTLLFSFPFFLQDGAPLYHHRWSLEHYPVKVKVKRKPSLCDYSLMGENLTRVDKHDYLGVSISSDLKWNSHISKISCKASRTLGLLKRTLSPCSQQVKATAYKMLVRPQIEYASEVWNPHTLKD